MILLPDEVWTAIVAVNVSCSVGTAATYLIVASLRYSALHNRLFAHTLNDLVPSQKRQWKICLVTLVCFLDTC